MPVVFRDKGLRYFFYSNEGYPREPAHIHVKGDGCDAKIWIDPAVAICDSYGFNSRDLGDILQVVEARRGQILKAWNDHFAD
jgi:hypothetical protein